MAEGSGTESARKFKNDDHTMRFKVDFFVFKMNYTRGCWMGGWLGVCPHGLLCCEPHSFRPDSPWAPISPGKPFRPGRPFSIRFKFQNMNMKKYLALFIPWGPGGPSGPIEPGGPLNLKWIRNNHLKMNSWNLFNSPAGPGGPGGPGRPPIQGEVCFIH